MTANVQSPGTEQRSESADFNRHSRAFTNNPLNSDQSQNPYPTHSARNHNSFIPAYNSESVNRSVNGEIPRASNGPRFTSPSRSDQNKVMRNRSESRTVNIPQQRNNPNVFSHSQSGPSFNTAHSPHRNGPSYSSPSRQGPVYNGHVTSIPVSGFQNARPGYHRVILTTDV